jgi:succinyl-CoA synthetase beta subunit
LDSAVDEAVRRADFRRHATQLNESIRKLFTAARSVEARSLEINPLVLTKSGQFVAADCRITIDDYAVARHPELKIEIAREFDHPPTALERVAYAVEQNDHRGTFYFAQLATAAAKGFQGTGRFSRRRRRRLDDVDGRDRECRDFTIANFTDTSGNPSASKVYRAARIILAQPDLVGYFGSGSGVASQEQYWSAYGLAKAFWELDLDIPAVIRLGGNTEDRAVDILHRMSKLLARAGRGLSQNRHARHDRRALCRTGRDRRQKWKPRTPRVPNL